MNVVAGNTYYLLLEGQSSDLTNGLISSSMDIGSSCASGGSSGTCDDSSYAANDGYCDVANSINYNGTSYCSEGTDCSDCSAVAVDEVLLHFKYGLWLFWLGFRWTSFLY